MRGRELIDVFGNREAKLIRPLEVRQFFVPFWCASGAACVAETRRRPASMILRLILSAVRRSCHVATVINDHADAAIFSDFRRSGLTQGDFCRQHNISLASFRYHFYKPRSSEPARSHDRSPAGIENRFLAVTVLPDPAPLATTSPDLKPSSPMVVGSPSPQDSTPKHFVASFPLSRNEHTSFQCWSCPQSASISLP